MMPKVQERLSLSGQQRKAFMCGNYLAGSAKCLLGLSHSCRGKTQGINLNQSEVRQSSTMKYVNPAASLKHKRKTHWTPATLLQTITLLERFHGNGTIWRTACQLDLPRENTRLSDRLICKSEMSGLRSRNKQQTKDRHLRQKK